MAATQQLQIRTVMVCSGSSCRKGSEQRRLCEALAEAGLVVMPTGCLGVCNGPVMAAPIKDRIEVVSRVRGSAGRRRVLSALEAGKRKQVKPLLVKGGRREKALRRVARVAARAS